MKARWFVLTALLALFPAHSRADEARAPIPNIDASPAAPLQQVGDPEPLPPQEGGEEPPTVPPQEGGEQPPTVPPQEGGEEPPTVPPQEGGEEPPTVPPQEGGEQPPTVPPQEGGEQPPTVPPQEGGEQPPTVPPQEGGKQPAPVPPQEGGANRPPAAKEPANAPVNKPTPVAGPDAKPATLVPTKEEGEPATPAQEGGEPTLPAPAQEGGEPNVPPAKAEPLRVPPTAEERAATSAPPPQELENLQPELPFAMEAPFTLTVNQVDKGEIILVLMGDDVFVSREELRAAGIGELKGREQELLGRRLLSLKSVSPPLSYELDERDIALRIVAPIELLPMQMLSSTGAPSNIVYQEKTSGFLNYSARVTDFKSLNLYQEVGASHEGNLAFSGMYLSTDHEPIRGMTNFTINERETRRRLIFGDTAVQTGTLGSSSILGGWTLAKTFELDPYVVRSPRIGYSGTTLTPANLDVYINGALVRSEPIQPGSFAINDLQVGGGRGMATYVIRDVFGQEQTVSIPFYVAGNVLAKGFEEFTYSLGALRESLGTESWGYDRVAFMGTHRRGVTDKLTLSGRLEASDRLITFGPAMTTLIPFGQIELEVGASQERDKGPGLATFLSYSFLSRYFSAGVIGRLVSDRYSTLNVGADMDRPTRSLAAYQATPIGKLVTISSRAQIMRTRDGDKAWQVGMSTGARIIYQLNVSASAGYGGGNNGDDQWNVLANLSYVFGGRTYVSTQGSLENGNGALDLTANRSLPIGTGYGFRAGATFDEVSSANAVVQYQTNFGRYGAGYSVVDLGHDRPLTHTYSLDAAGGLAIVPGVGLFATLPVADGFGVIRVPGVKNVRGYISHKEIGRTDRNGNLVVPNVLSYYGNRLTIDPSDIPMRYSIDVTDVTLAPPQRGVAVAEFPVTLPHFYRGRAVVDDHGKRINPRYGQLRIVTETKEVISPFGSEGEFDLEGLAPGSYQAVIEYADGVCEMQLDAPEMDSPVIELGELVCSLP